jgi:hypothetical protein
MPESRLDDLNPEQLRAAIACEGPVLTIAGALHGQDQNSCGADGLARFARDQSEPDHASHVHAQGFGRDVAPGEEALSETGSSTLGTVWGGTFHSVANRLLRTYGEAIGLDPDFTVMVEAVNPSAALQETLFQAPHCSLAGSMSCNPTNARCFDLDRLCNDMHGFRSFLIMVIQHWRANVVSVFAWSRALQERAFSLFPRD